MTMKRDLPVVLKPEEVNQKGVQLAMLENERAALEQQAKDSAGGFRQKLKPIKKQIRELAQAVATGKELRPVAIKQIEAMVNGAAEYERLDTHERWTEAAEEKDGQKNLPVDKIGPKGSKKPHFTAATKGDSKKKPNGPSTEFSTGEVAIGIGDDGGEYDLTAEEADTFRNGRNVHVQGPKGPVEILKLKKAPKGKAADDGPPPPKGGKGAPASARAH